MEAPAPVITEVPSQVIAGDEPALRKILLISDFADPSADEQIVRWLSGGAFLREQEEAEEPPPEMVLQRLLGFARRELKATELVVEPYISTDFGDEYQHAHARTYFHVPRRAQRLHFFRSSTAGRRLTYADILGLDAHLQRRLDGDAPPGPPKGGQWLEYLGFSVIRPLDPPTVGETVLKFPSSENFPSRRVPFCSAPYDVHLLGHELHVEGAPFIQQERSVSVCADADLWMVARLMHARGETSRYRPSEVERMARDPLSVGPPRYGLTPEQVFCALEDMGLHPDRITPRSAGEAMNVINAFTTSGIPVIATLGILEAIPTHVVTILGCRLGPTPGRIDTRFPPRPPKPLGDRGAIHDESASTNTLNSIAAYVRELILHDDAHGVYRRASLAEDTREPRLAFDLPTAEEKTEARTPRRTGAATFRITDLIVPMPARVAMTLEDVQGHAHAWLRRGLLRQEQFRADPRSTWEDSEIDGCILRPYLRLTSSFRHDVLIHSRAEPGSEVDRGLLNYWLQEMPRYVWVVELLKPEEGQTVSYGSPCVVGEMIFDSTSHFRNPWRSLLSFRLNGKIMYRGPAASPSVQGAAPRKGPATGGRVEELPWRTGIRDTRRWETSPTPLVARYKSYLPFLTT